MSHMCCVQTCTRMHTHGTHTHGHIQAHSGPSTHVTRYTSTHARAHTHTLWAGLTVARVLAGVRESGQ